MASINDFGRHIPGAAKHRNRDWNIQADGVGSTLAEIFPEPDWGKLIADGVPARNVGLARALRDSIGAKPQAERKQQAWLRQARAISAFAHDLAEQGAAEITVASARAQGVGKLLLKADLYREMGHDRSLRKFRIIDYNGKTLAVEGRLIRAEADSVPELARRVSAYLDRTSGQTKVKWYTRTLEPNQRDGRVMILAGLSGGIKIDIEEAPSATEAQRRVRQEAGRLREILDRIRSIPSARSERDAERVGPVRRDRDVTPEMLVSACHLDGLQFGNSLSDAERQNEMNQAYDAIADMKHVLGGKLGLTERGRRPGLAFGARGKGGTNAAKAHYEPGLHVINLTRRNGAGSLGHEWYHANDDGSAPFRQIERVLASLPLAERSRLLDATRSSPYYALPREMSARAFETWIKFRLDGEGIRNDYLANIMSEESWSRSDYLGAARYPYPTDAEMPAIDRAFSAMFQVAPAAPRRAPEQARQAGAQAARAAATPAASTPPRAPSPAAKRDAPRPPCPAVAQEEPLAGLSKGRDSASKAPPAPDAASPRWMDDLEF